MDINRQTKRKLLAKVHLPKEAQQIDRAMEDFAKQYYECNPGLVDSPGKQTNELDNKLIDGLTTKDD